MIQNVRLVAIIAQCVQPLTANNVHNVLIDIFCHKLSHVINAKLNAQCVQITQSANNAQNFITSIQLINYVTCVILIALNVISMKQMKLSNAHLVVLVTNSKKISILSIVVISVEILSHWNFHVTMIFMSDMMDALLIAKLKLVSNAILWIIEPFVHTHCLLNSKWRVFNHKVITFLLYKLMCFHL